MNKPENSNPERRLEELELELEREGKSRQKTTNLETAAPEKNYLQIVLNWFDRLPTLGKVGVVVGGIVIGFSLLNSVLKLVTSVLVIAILAVVLYGAYKFIIK